MRLRIIIVSCYLISALVGLGIADAATVANTQETTTKVETTTPSSTTEKSVQDFGLTPQEMTRYLALMQGQDGLWYKNLMPAAVLGMHAQTLEEQQHYAEIVAKEEHDRLARELAFNNAVYSALTKLYPDEPLIRPFNMSPYNPLQKNSRATSGVTHE